MGVFAGFDLGGTHLKYGLIDKNKHLVIHNLIPTPDSIEDLISLIKKLMLELTEQSDQPVLSVGFGFPGIFSQREHVIRQSPNYSRIEHFNLVPALSKFISVPFFIDNDANMAAYGEYSAGAGKGAHSLVLLTIGSGVGTGIILGGKLWQGACGFAGELGHATVNPDGDKCNCGSHGCLETEISASKIVKNYNALVKTSGVSTSQEVYSRACQGEKSAIEAFSLAAKFLGIGIAMAVNILNPERIILGGGVMKAGDLILQPACAEARKRAYNDSFDCCTIQQALLGNTAGFIGAACWAKDKLKSDPERNALT